MLWFPLLLKSADTDDEEVSPSASVSDWSSVSGPSGKTKSGSESQDSVGDMKWVGQSVDGWMDGGEWGVGGGASR
jgi:hypothetical protein